ncbi:MAG: hypothetical protein IH978_02365 [Nitrospinae bacterium]|nr:hypothetical protein [Nitrospinota bacterium]
MRWKRFILFMIMVALASPVMQLDDADAKRKRRYSPPPLKILDISTSPTPFAPGNGPLAIMIDVELPKNLSNVDLLEVSSTISFPSKRSIRFLYSRHPIEEAVVSGGTPKIRTTLLWDGKDQTNQWVSAGTYTYEIRAKLMANTDGPPRTKMVSLRVRGELEVSSPESLTNSETHLEHVPFTSDDTPQEELGAGSDALETSEVEGSDSEDNAAQEGALKGAVTGGVKASVSATQ